MEDDPREVSDQRTPLELIAACLPTGLNVQWAQRIIDKLERAGFRIVVADREVCSAQPGESPS